MNGGVCGRRKSEVRRGVAGVSGKVKRCVRCVG